MDLRTVYALILEDIVACIAQYLFWIKSMVFTFQESFQ